MLAHNLLRCIVLCGLIAASPTLVDAAETLTPEPTAGTYYFVTHYRERIEAPAEVVWPHLIDLKQWMYDFDLTTEVGNAGEAGQILNLYEGQAFQLLVTAAEPPTLLTVANLPLLFQGEFGTGVGVFTLHENNGVTEVALTGSRRYTWQGGGPNPLRQRRGSAQFQAQTGDLWRRFLGKLKSIVEGTQQ